MFLFFLLRLLSFPSEFGKTALPLNLMLALIIRGEEKIIPNGTTELKSEDKIILCGKSTETIDGVKIFEHEIDKYDSWCGKSLKEISTDGELIIMIKRGDKLLIPDGKTQILENDIVVVNKNE